MVTTHLLYWLRSIVCGPLSEDAHSLQRTWVWALGHDLVELRLVPRGHMLPVGSRESVAVVVVVVVVV